MTEKQVDKQKLLDYLKHRCFRVEGTQYMVVDRDMLRHRVESGDLDVKPEFAASPKGFHMAGRPLNCELCGQESVHVCKTN